MRNIGIELKWAIVFSLVGLLWMLGEKMSGLHDEYLDYHLYLTNLFALPAILMMVLALREKKWNHFEGNMNYTKGLLSGIILSLLIAILSPLTQWITSFVISPEYFPNVIKRSVEIGYFNSQEEARAQFNYPNYAIQGAIGALLMGIVTSAIAMIFIRPKKLKNDNEHLP